MKPISRTVHGVLDYLMGVFLIASPTFFELDGKEADSLVFFISGGAVIIYSLLTKYELGAIKIIPMRMHLVLDILSALFLAASPWIFGFADRIFVPYLVLGLIEIVAVILTNPTGKDSTKLIS